MVMVDSVMDQRERIAIKYRDLLYKAAKGGTHRRLITLEGVLF